MSKLTVPMVEQLQCKNGYS